jgi:predicted nucleotidyltransferase
MTHDSRLSPDRAGTGLGPDSENALWAIREIKAFLDSDRRWIHSLVLFGSHALGQARKYSDVDFLVLLKGKDRAKYLSRILVDFELGRYTQRDQRDPVRIQVVPFDEKGVEHLFELSSPLAHAFRHGVVIWDDGWFRELLSRPYPKWPTSEYAVEAVTKWIAWQYFRSAVDLHQEILTDHAPDGFCSKRGRCIGHFAGDILARVLSRMLYVTLPHRGFLPLSKQEALALAVETYGREAWRPVALAMNVLRKDRSISYREFRTLFPFARRLFRECLKICDRDPRLLEALRQYAGVYRERKRRVS